MWYDSKRVDVEIYNPDLAALIRKHGFPVGLAEFAQGFTGEKKRYEEIYYDWECSEQIPLFSEILNPELEQMLIRKGAFSASMHEMLDFLDENIRAEEVLHLYRGFPITRLIPFELCGNDRMAKDLPMTWNAAVAIRFMGKGEGVMVGYTPTLEQSRITQNHRLTPLNERESIGTKRAYELSREAVHRYYVLHLSKK